MDNLEEMDKFLEKHNLPKLNQEETENINRPITSTESETLMKSFPTGTSLVVQWLRIHLPMPEDMGSSPGPGRSHILWSS